MITCYNASHKLISNNIKISIVNDPVHIVIQTRVCQHFLPLDIITYNWPGDTLDVTQQF